MQLSNSRITAIKLRQMEITKNPKEIEIKMFRRDMSYILIWRLKTDETKWKECDKVATEIKYLVENMIRGNIMRDRTPNKPKRIYPLNWELMGNVFYMR